MVSWRYGQASDPEKVSSFEKAFSVILSAEFKDVVVHNDGGIPDPSSFYFPDSDKESGYNCAVVGEFLPFSPEDKYDGIAAFNDRLLHGYPGFIIFAKEASGWLFAFDCRQVMIDPPVVVLRDDLPNPENVIPAANNFASFLSILRNEPPPSSIGGPNL